MRRLFSMIRVLVAAVALFVALPWQPGLAQTPGPNHLYLPIVAAQTPRPAAVRLIAAADAYIDQDEPTTNSGASYFLMTGNDQPVAPALGVLRSLIRFDLPAPGAWKVAKASLRVDYRGFWDYPDQPRDIRVHAALDPWDELMVTWENQPAQTDEVFGSVVINANDQFGYREIDVTGLVQQWCDGALTNNGLYLVGPEAAGSDASYRAFMSRESVATNLPYPPELVITFQ